MWHVIVVYSGSANGIHDFTNEHDAYEFYYRCKRVGYTASMPYKD